MCIQYGSKTPQLIRMQPLCSAILSVLRGGQIIIFQVLLHLILTLLFVLITSSIICQNRLYIVYNYQSHFAHLQVDAKV